MDELTIRPLTADDAPALARLAEEQGRNLAPDELARFVALEGAHGLVLVERGEVVGGVTTLRCFEHAVVGPVLVRGGASAVGLSLALLQAVVHELQRLGVARLVAEASEEEARLLAALGFTRRRETVVLERAPAPLAAAGGTRRLEEGDLLDLGALDAGAVGWGRKEFLALLRQAFPSGARAWGDDELRGYALVRAARRGHHVGPLVTAQDSVETARALLRDAVASVSDGPVVALLPDGSALADALAEMGFREVARLVRMEAGEPFAPEATEWLVGSRTTG